MRLRDDAAEEGRDVMAWGVLAVFFGFLGLLLGLVIGILGASIYFSDRLARARQALGQAKPVSEGLALPTESAKPTAEATAPPAEDKEPPAEVEAPPAECPPDDLERIVGIGQVFARRLREAGITTFGQLAAMTAEEIGAATDVDAGRISHDNWPGQAAKLTAG